MDFSLSPEIEDIRLRTRRFVEEHVLPLEADHANYDDHENIRLDEEVRAKAKAWLAATIQYSNGQAAGMTVPARADFERFEWRLTFAERQRAKAILNNLPMARTEDRTAMAAQPRSERQ